MLSELSSVLNLLEGGFGHLKILVVGDLMLDRYILGDVDRISPEAPVPVLRHARRYERAGGSANVAMNLAGLGCEAFLAGFWGDDTEKTELAAILETAHVNTLGVVSDRCRRFRRRASWAGSSNCFASTSRAATTGRRRKSSAFWSGYWIWPRKCRR